MTLTLRSRHLAMKPALLLLLATVWTLGAPAHGQAFRVSSETGDQVEPSVAMNANGEFVVVWTDWPDLLDRLSAVRPVGSARR